MTEPQPEEGTEAWRNSCQVRDRFFFFAHVCTQKDETWDGACLTCAGGSEDSSLWDEKQLALPRGVLTVGGQVELGAWG